MSSDWPAPADAIARYRQTDRGQWQSTGEFSRGSPGSELLATGDAAAYAEYLRSSPLGGLIPGPHQPLRRPAGEGELLGLVLRGGGGGAPLPPDNPWGLPAEPELDRAIRQVWAPVAGLLPDFVNALAESVFALALMRHGDRDSLAYLMVSWVSSDVRDVAASASIEDLMDAREITVGEMWGSAPAARSDDRAARVLGAPASAPLRALASVHGSLLMLDEETWLDLEHIDTSFTDGLREDGDPEDELTAGNLVLFVVWRDSTFLLDIDVRDEAGGPTVVDASSVGDKVAGPWRVTVPMFLRQHLPDMRRIDA